MREGETIENSDHTFISPIEIEKYKGEMVAYTERVGYCSFATAAQLMENDIYIINPSGFIELTKKVKEMNLDVELISITINTPYTTCRDRAKKRGDYDSWYANYKSEDKEFKDFEKSGLSHYYVLNNGTVDEAVEKLSKIISKVEKRWIKIFYSTTRTKGLAKSLSEIEDTFLTVTVGNREYIIKEIRTKKTHANADDSSVYKTLYCEEEI